MMGGVLLIPQHGRSVVDVADDQIEIAVVVEIARRQPAARPGNPQPAPGCFGDVHELRAGVPEQLVLLPEALLQLGILIDIGLDVAVGEEEVRTPIEVGIEERRPPSHAHEGWARQPGG